LKESSVASISSYKIREDFKLDTMDIVVAVLLGVIQAVIEVFAMLGFLERTFWAMGPYGFLFYAAYNGMTWILFYAGVYLRKRACIVMLAVTVTALVRWFAGDPDGPILIFHALFPATFGVMVIVIMRWHGGRLLFAATAAVTAAANQLSAFIGVGGFQLAQSDLWAIGTMLFAAVWGLVWGLAAWYLGKALEHAGVPSLDKPPAVSDGQINHA
jgi:hypothetical protein